MARRSKAKELPAAKASSEEGKGDENERDAKRVWYFAYGSNMSPITMRRRRLKPAESVAAVLEDYRLLFDHVGFPFIEPSFANVAPEKGSSVHGVVHHLTEEEWKRVLASEGGGGYTEGYFPVEVEVTTYDQRKIRAFTLESSHGARHHVLTWHTHPSKRYIGLLLDGARHFGIDSDYVKTHIESQPTNSTHSVVKVVALVLIVSVALPIFIPFFGALRLGISTRFFHVFSHSVKSLIWRLHYTTPLLSLSAIACVLAGYAGLSYTGYSLITLAMSA